MQCGRVSLAVGDRTATLLIPSYLCSNNITSAPLVISVHCFGCNSNMEIGRLSAWTKQWGFVGLAPEGLQSSWNAKECCGEALETKVDDVGFISSLVSMLLNTTLQQERGWPRISPDAIYVTGYSNGGFMASLLGLLSSGSAQDVNWVAGIAPMAGDQGDPSLYAAATKPLPVLMYSSVDDQLVKWAGCCMASQCCCKIGLDTEVCSSNEWIFNQWLKINKCVGGAGTRPLLALDSLTPQQEHMSSSEFWNVSVSLDRGVPGGQALKAEDVMCMRGEGCAAPTVLCRWRGPHYVFATGPDDRGFIPQFFMRHACESHGGEWKNPATDAFSCSCSTLSPSDPYCLQLSSASPLSDSPSSSSSVSGSVPNSVRPPVSSYALSPVVILWVSIFVVAVVVVLACFRRWRRRVLETKFSSLPQTFQEEKRFARVDAKKNAATEEEWDLNSSDEERFAEAAE